MSDSLTYNEKELLLRIGNGDETAFEVFFRKHKDPVYSFALHFTRNVHAAEEIVQEIFLKIWLQRELLPGVHDVEAWLYTITRNLSFDHLKKAANEAALKNRWQQQALQVEESTREETDFRQYRNYLQQAIKSLPPQQQQVYLLAKENGLKYDEIAGQLQLSKNTIKSHMNAALRSIREYLKHHMGDAFILLLLDHWK